MTLGSTMVLSIEEARRTAVAAQGFGRRRDSPAEVLDVVRALGALQLDSVNVLCRAHYMPVFARCGAYDRAALDAAAWAAPRALFEYWGHQASLMPVSLQPLFRWRMERAANGEGVWSFMARFGRERRAYVREVLAEVVDRGPLRAAEISTAKRKPGSWWNRSDAKTALEWLFWTGRVSVAARRHFERSYDLTERVLPPEVMATPTPDMEDAHRELLAIAARALGVATEDDLRDYYRLSATATRPRLDELCALGILRPVRVEGWSKPAYVALDVLGAARRACALLTPFDPLIWHRARTERLFGFRYRIEIYTPAAARKHGYYVVPFLLGDRLVARLDLKSDRDRSELLVRAAHIEDGIEPSRVVDPLAAELARLAAWLGLERVRIGRKGRLARSLRAAQSLRAAER